MFESVLIVLLPNMLLGSVLSAVGFSVGAAAGFPPSVLLLFLGFMMCTGIPVVGCLCSLFSFFPSLPQGISTNLMDRVCIYQGEATSTFHWNPIVREKTTKRWTRGSPGDRGQGRWGKSQQPMEWKIPFDTYKRKETSFKYQR